MVGVYEWVVNFCGRSENFFDARIRGAPQPKQIPLFRQMCAPIWWTACRVVWVPSLMPKESQPSTDVTVAQKNDAMMRTFLHFPSYLLQLKIYIYEMYSGGQNPSNVSKVFTFL